MGVGASSRSNSRRSSTITITSLEKKEEKDIMNQETQNRSPDKGSLPTGPKLISGTDIMISYSHADSDMMKQVRGKYIYRPSSCIHTQTPHTHMPTHTYTHRHTHSDIMISYSHADSDMMKKVRGKYRPSSCTHTERHHTHTDTHTDTYRHTHSDIMIS